MSSRLPTPFAAYVPFLKLVPIALLAAFAAAAPQVSSPPEAKAAATATATTTKTATPAPAVLLGKVDQRTYFFEDAKKDMEYSLYVPKTYTVDKASPLVVLLHGLGSNPKQVIGYQGITEEAERRGYIVVAPFGFNSRGWYGSRGNGKAGLYFGTKEDPDNLGELSEKDVMNVLAIVRREFRIDEQRVYLMGHSMGGAGTVYLGFKQPTLWAALAPLAPALDDSLERLAKLKDTPIYMVQGDQDRLVPVKTARLWVQEMKKLGIEHTYVEIPGGDHVNSFTRNPQMIAGVFDFFDSKRRGAVTAGSKAVESKPAQPKVPEPSKGEPK